MSLHDMATLQLVVPDEIAAAIQHEADSSVVKTSVSRVLAGVVIPAFKDKAAQLAAKKSERRSSGSDGMVLLAAAKAMPIAKKPVTEAAGK